MSASFEQFDYQLRSNKHIERKLVFELLLRARKYFSLEKYKYLGLGSLWFADHRLAHRLLNIDELISIEANEYAARADFNKPYGSIKVLPGMSHEVLPQFKKEDWDTPYIVWMDYDGLLDENVQADLSKFVTNLQPGSVILITLNASFRSYKTNQTGIAAAERRGETIDPRAVEKLIRFLGNVVPEKYLLKDENGKFRDVTAAEFPQIMAESILKYLGHKVTTSGREGDAAENKDGDAADNKDEATAEQTIVENPIVRKKTKQKPLCFVPLFNMFHKDGADMITVGGAICAEKEVEAWRSLLAADPVLKSQASLPIHHKLDLIPITLREKLVLDSLLPSVQPLGKLAANSGLKIEDEQIEKYRQHYRHFPMFFESPL